MLKIFLYLIEGFIIGYFDFKFIKKDFNYYLISFFSIIFTLSHVIAEQYLVYDYLSIVITITILYLMNGLDNKISKTMNLFISTFIGIVICMFDSMSILKIIFVLKTGSEGVWYSQDIVYYIILVVTRLMIFITLYLLDKKQIFKQLIISNKYLTLLTSISLVNCLITSFIANGIYMNSISYGYVYLLAIIFMVTIISVFIIILSINKDNMRIKKQEIELIQLKSIEEKYIAVQSQNKRNEEIKHDLEYFLPPEAQPEAALKYLHGFVPLLKDSGKELDYAPSKEISQKLPPRCRAPLPKPDSHSHHLPDMSSPHAS